ncbi:unnamed protein product, partial [Meganyctiphanes norvegica]
MIHPTLGPAMLALQVMRVLPMEMAIHPSPATLAQELPEVELQLNLILTVDLIRAMIHPTLGPAMLALQDMRVLPMEMVIHPSPATLAQELPEVELQPNLILTVDLIRAMIHPTLGPAMLALQVMRVLPMEMAIHPSPATLAQELPEVELQLNLILTVDLIRAMIHPTLGPAMLALQVMRVLQMEMAIHPSPATLAQELPEVELQLNLILTMDLIRAMNHLTLGPAMLALQVMRVLLVSKISMNPVQVLNMAPVLILDPQAQGTNHQAREVAPGMADDYNIAINYI